MSGQGDFEARFGEAQALHRDGRLDAAERAYLALAQPGAERRELVLQALVTLYMQARRAAEVVDALVALTEEAPDNFSYCAQLATLLDRLGHTEPAIAEYQRLIARQPDLAVAHFNVALLLKRALRYSDALAAYEKAIELGIDRLEEVYSNIGVLYSQMRQPARAREMYERALEIDAAYKPALFNLAGLHEESGERREATALYERILELDPQHWDSLARLAYAASGSEAADAMAQRLRTALEQPVDDTLAREGLYFALGRLLDSRGDYGQAVAAYREANAIGKRRNPPYDRNAVEQSFSGLMSLFDAQWIRDAQTESTASPVFVCGMFRSGSTLVERMLGAHPSITAGGELDFMPWLIAHRLAPYPERMESIEAQELEQLAEEYLARVRELYPGADTVTDKRPDNFAHLGLIRALYPRARIVYTRRRAVDNCLSIYFQQLGGNLSYAADLGHTAHYHAQHERLMAHWQSCFGDNIFTVDYDELVQSPEILLRRLLAFLGLDWDERCLAFETTDSTVQTASIWQVREGLHTESSGRWRNYAPHIPELATLFGLDDTDPA